MISISRLSTYPRFETEAQGNSEMTYCLVFAGKKRVNGGRDYAWYHLNSRALAREARAAEHH